MIRLSSTVSGSSVQYGVRKELMSQWAWTLSAVEKINKTVTYLATHKLTATLPGSSLYYTKTKLCQSRRASWIHRKHTNVHIRTCKWGPWDTIDRSVSCPLEKYHCLCALISQNEWGNRHRLLHAARSPFQSETVRIFIVLSENVSSTLLYNEEFNWFRHLFKKVAWRSNRTLPVFWGGRHLIDTGLVAFFTLTFKRHTHTHTHTNRYAQILNSL